MDPHERYTDEELVRLLLATQDEALRAELWFGFWRRFQPIIALTIRRRIFRRTRWADHALVDDLVQNTFMKICKDDFKVLRTFEFRHEKALRAFLRVIAANIVEDYFRGEKIVVVPLDPLQPEPSNFSDLIHRRNQIQKVEDCLQQLADKPNFARDYKIFWLHNRDGVTAQEISQLPDIGFNTVKGVESALLRLNRWVLQCVQRGKAK
jgi:RNA polymerase sigma-70 factor (ECF subfamily)